MNSPGIPSILDQIEHLFGTHGRQLYELGSPDGVSQHEHALQTASLAEHEGADDALVAAALLHDIGHLLPEREAGDLLDTRDDLHQYIALPFLRPAFDDDVLEPIRLHVEAKRYLCTTEPGYWASLSPGSQHSLALQGGPFSVDEAAAFIARPHAPRAVALRRWDDRAKHPGAATPDWPHFRRTLSRVLRSTGAD